MLKAMRAHLTLVPMMLALGGPGAQAAPLPLANDGQTSYVIALARDAAAPEQTAARELADHLAQVTGAAHSVVAPEEVGDRPAIAVGPGAARALWPEADLDLGALGHDGIVLRTRAPHLILTGAEGARRGTLYAVYTFLEDVVGCRWWSSKESFVPSKPTLEVPELDQRYVPQLRYREAFYRDAFDGIFAARCKCNGHFERIPPEYGGHYTLIGWCHTFYLFLPPDEYFAQHPDWYSEINGERTAEHTQLCLTNDEMRAEFTRRVLEAIRADPSAGMVSVAQNDWHGACQCENCRKVVEEEGSESGPILRFVNAVAEEIEKEYPDFLVETLAYSYTRKPPAKVKPRKNVVVRLCSIECSFSQPLATGPQNAQFQADIQGWSAIAPQLYIWDYVTNFANYILPHPNLRVLAPNIRYFVENGAIGLFEQGDAGCSCGDFVELRAWLLAHLMWDPTRDEQALIAEFLRGYYGPAAEPLAEYIALTHDAVDRSGVYLRCYMNDTSPWLGLADLNRATELFAEAARLVADDPVLSARVRRARMPLDHAWIQRQRALRRVAQMTGQPYLGPADPVAFCEDFINAAREFNAGSYAEGRPFDDLIPALRAQTEPPSAAGPPPPEAQGLADEDWIDIQEGEFRLHGLGDWVTVVEDDSASNGRAARMPGTHTQWAVQYPLSGDLGDLGTWHFYVVARCQATADTGPAFQIGLYDAAASKGLSAITETLDKAGDGEYRTYDLGAHEAKAGMYVWVAPVGKPDAVSAVYVDRIFLIREK